MTSCPGRVWASTETRLPWVPELTKSAPSLPARRAASSSSRLTVGSSSHTSSPTSARAMASRIAGVGRVSVSERRSTMSCMALPRGRPESPRRAPAPVGVGELGGQLSELVLGLRHPPFLGIHVGQPEQRLGHHQGARVLLQQGFEPLARSRRVPLVPVVARDPPILSGSLLPVV